jgi:hypothetical protein
MPRLSNHRPVPGDLPAPEDVVVAVSHEHDAEASSKNQE